MDFDIATIRDDITLEVVLEYLRKIKKLPDHTDKLFVVDHSGSILGVLPLERIVVSESDIKVKDVMSTDAVLFRPEDTAHEASNAFERYDLVTAPVVGDSKKWLNEQDRCEITLFNGIPLSVLPPNFVELEIVETDPGLKGDTAQGGSKPATLSTGATIKVPLFLNQGEIVRVDTRTGEYQNRAGKD